MASTSRKGFIRKVPSELELVAVVGGFVYLQKIVDGLCSLTLKKKNQSQREKGI